MKEVIVVTGASSGIGALTVKALAMTGHTVYAGMRNIVGRNATRVQESAAFAADSVNATTVIAARFTPPD